MDRQSIIARAIRTVPDFPVDGILFRDVTTLVKDREAYGLSCELMQESVSEFGPVDYFAGIESRGFIYGSVLADRFNKGLVLIRKPGKLPARVLYADYKLEYGVDRIEVHADAVEEGKSYLVIDDLLATGGTAEATCRLIKSGGGRVAGCLFLIELPGLQGRKKLAGTKVVSIISFDGE